LHLQQITLIFPTLDIEKKEEGPDKLKTNSFISYSLALIVLLAAGCASHLMEAEKAYSDHHYSRTATLCRAAVKVDSTDKNAWLLLGQSFTAMDSLYKAQRAVEQAFALSPGSGKIKKQLIIIYTRLGENAKKEKKQNRALYYYKKANDLKTGQYPLIHEIANLALSRGYLEQAALHFNCLLKVYPDSALFQNRLDEIHNRTLDAEQQYEKGQYAYTRNHLKTAKTRLTRALKYKSDHEEARYLHHLTLGRLLYQKGSKSACWEAIDHFGQAMSLKPEHAEPHFYMAQTYEKKDRYEFTNAIDEYKTVLELDPQGPFATRSKKKIGELTRKKQKYDDFWGK